MPRFYGGYVGFFAYESAAYAEKKLAELSPKPSKFHEHMSDIVLMKASKIIVFDNFNQTIELVVNANPQEQSLESIQEDLLKSNLSSLQTMSIHSNRLSSRTILFAFLQILVLMNMPKL